MTYPLMLRLCAARGRDLMLDTDVLVWVEEQIGWASDAEYLDHTHGLTGELTGAWRIVQKIAPDAAIRFEWDPLLRQVEAVADRGAADPITARGSDLANTLIAAALACHAQGHGLRSVPTFAPPVAVERRA